MRKPGLLKRLLSRLASDLNTGQRATRRMVHGSQWSTPGAITQNAPLADAYNQTAGSLLSFYNTARLLVGTLTGANALTYTYRVQFEKTKQPVNAVKGTDTTCSIMGAKELNTLQAGTQVLCAWSEQMPYAVILCVVPTLGATAKLQMASVLTGSTRQRVDELHKKPLKTHGNGGIPDFLSGRLFDATCVGEAGWTTETGMRIFLDPFMALLGADEMTQIAAFYHDQLLRITGFNLQIWSAARECESFLDQGETIDWTGYAMYPWEQLGLLDNTDPQTKKTAQEWQQDEPWYSRVEPKDDYAMPFHREVEYHGYLGQGGKRTVSGMPDSGDHLSYNGGSGVNDPKLPGLFDAFVTSDGRYCVQAAKGISIVKRSFVVPARIRRMDAPVDGGGNDDNNYKFSSKEGEGPEHKITGDIETQGDDTQFNRAMGIKDMHAYFFNYAGVHPFHYRDKDYKLYEERELEYMEGQTEAVPVFNKLASSMFIDPVEFKKTAKIDHRYGEQDFYQLSCGMHMLDDGGLVIFDGYGSEIRMTGGSMFLSAPGDIWLKSGRNTNVWAGFDAILRAKNSMDLSTTEHDIRLKAEKNLHALAGNSGAGGILLESRGAQTYNFDEPGEKTVSGGIMLRSTEASVVAWSSSIYLRTGGGDITPGPIVLDAARGQQDVTLYSDRVNQYVGSGVFSYFSTDSGPAAFIMPSGSGFPGGVYTDGTVVAAGSGVFGSNVLSGGAVGAVQSPYVGELTGETLAQLQETTTEATRLIGQTVPADGTQYFAGVLTPTFYDAEKPGNDDVIKKAQFSFRVLDDYHTADFKLYEDSWQQTGRQTGSADATWEEKPVTTRGQDTYPYPGKENFTDAKLYQQDLKIFNVQSGRSEDRGNADGLTEAYSEPKFQEPKPVSLSQYLVIR